MNISELQQYIKNRDFNKDNPNGYFLKLIEEIGELAEALRKSHFEKDGKDFKGSVEEEIYDCIYYLCAIANLHEIDIENCHILKDKLNKKKYGK